MDALKRLLNVEENETEAPLLEVANKLPNIEPNAQTPEQITITIMNNGDVNIVNTAGVECLVSKEVLQREKIDTKNLTDHDIRLLLQMTMAPPSPDGPYPYAAGSRQIPTPIFSPHNPSVNHRKRRNKEIFDPSTAKRDNTNPCKSPTPRILPAPRKSSGAIASTDAGEPSANSSCIEKFLNKTKSSGGVIYKPTSLQSSTNDSSSVSLPRLYCVVCDKLVAKTKADYILVRLPAHPGCVDGTMKNIHSDTNEVANKEEENNDENAAANIPAVDDNKTVVI